MESTFLNNQVISELFYVLCFTGILFELELFLKSLAIESQQWRDPRNHETGSFAL